MINIAIDMIALIIDLIDVTKIKLLIVSDWLLEKF